MKIFQPLNFFKVHFLIFYGYRPLTLTRIKLFSLLKATIKANFRVKSEI